MCKSLVLVLMLFSLVLSSGKAYSQTTFAILPMEKQGDITPETVEEAQVGLSQLLIDSKKYIIVDRKRINNVLKEQAFQFTGVTDQSSVVKLGKIFNAEKII